LNSSEIPKVRCPGCGYEMEAATPVGEGSDEARPFPGCFSVCAKCGEITVFAEDMTQRLPTLAELTSLPPHLNALLTRAQKLIRKHRPVWEAEQARLKKK
jgi:hypothetical protein